jgi:C_GCAxxG_C_C family probable redox protein
MSNKSEQAVATFKAGFNCSQAVLSAFCEELGLERGEGEKIASGFGGGIGHMAETCGAVTGAIMAIGLKRGMSVEGSPNKSNQQVYSLVTDFVREFTKRNNSIKCRDLLGVDFNDEEAYRQARQKGLFYTVCTKYVNDAVEIVESLLKL